MVLSQQGSEKGPQRATDEAAGDNARDQTVDG